MHVHTSHQSYVYPPFMLCPWQRVHKNPWCNLQHFCYHSQDDNFHMGWKQLHVLPLTTFNSFCWRTNIVFNKDGIRTLANVATVNPMWMDVLSHFYTIQGITTFIAAQAK